MGLLVYILGRSGTGKSYSMRNFKPEEIAVINVQGKILPFRGSGQIKTVNTDDSYAIVKAIKELSTTYKSIVVDDYQYLMANEFMRRSAERGYDKFTEIARHAWDIADAVKTLSADVIVYIMCHTDTDPDGFEKLKTIGKLLDEKIVLEGMSTIVLKTAVSDGQYMFLTQNNGHDTVKSPAGMFPTYAIDNDLKYVDEKIRNYYGLGNFLTDDQLSAKDEAAAVEGVEIEKPKRRGRSGKAKEEEQSQASEEEKKTKRRVTVKEDYKAALDEARAEYVNKMDELNADKGEEVPMENFEIPEAELPKRKRRIGKAVETAVTEPEVETPAAEPEEPKARRRRRV